MSDNHQGTLFSFFFLRKVPPIIWGLVLIVFGLVAYHSMSKEALPDLAIPTFYITTTWEGANSSMVEKSITQKIEKELRGLKGIKSITSGSTYSSSLIMVTFEAECSILESQQLLRQQLTMVRSELPKSVKEPKIEFASVNDLPVVEVALSGNVDITVLERLGRELQQKLKQVPGVRKINRIGIRKEIIHVQIHPERLKGFGISASLIHDRIMNNGFDAPWGRFENNDIQFSLRMNGVYNELSDLKNLYIGKQLGGGVVRLEDVATVTRSHMKGATKAALSWEGGDFEPVVALSFLKSPGYDTIELVRTIREGFNTANALSSWPMGVHWRFTNDQAEMIQTELDRGFTNGWQAMLAVFCVLLVLLTWREAAVAALSVPLTLLGTVAILWAMGYTFNLLVIIGMVIALGLLVDDFILIMEGMHEAIYIRKLGFAQAVRATISTYAVPSFSGSITTILVFTPLAFIGGVDGKFLRVIPVTVAVCLIMSYTVSVLIGPQLLRPFLSNSGDHGPGFIDNLSHKLEKKLADWLNHAVIPNKKRATLWVTGVFVLFLLSLVASEGMRTTLYPNEDGRTIGISVELAKDSTMEDSGRVAKQLESILKDKPYIQNVMLVIGGKDSYSRSSMFDHMNDTDTPHIIGFGCYLVPGKDRDKIAFDYVQGLKKEFEDALINEPGAVVLINAAKGGPTEGDPLQIQITGADFNRLREIAQAIKNELGTISGIYDIRDSIGPARSEMQYSPMQEALDHHGLSQVDLSTQMMVYMENEKVADFQRPGTQTDLEVRLGTWWNSQDGKMAGPKSWHELSGLSIINEEGDAIPLKSIAVPTMTAATPMILHTNGERSVTILAKNDNIYIPEVISQMHPILKEMQKEWPEGYSYSFVGEKEADKTYENMFLAFCGAIVLVYAILALLFDSLKLPVIILSTVLFAMVGVFFGFMLLGLPFSFSAAIGIVALVGIVVNDAIIVVETIRNHAKNGLPTFEAARRGAADRLRPITSTTITNFAGLLPLALSDPGWAPICQAIIFGEMTATVGAVVLIPALYVLLAKK
ncbi:efflux RND transporter permease subunit [uncultured Pseudodesulfovibrio sp.]|uniref:efflux RND transporter permease subunit n=1 Tax=uncultured Pseudodesulfovibrio sp. TaxID=2035858 RepID=UPI0029C812A2|nr:efflux RND transporter permease subunit [uncultured Pseudodesulfovibrio sp.]